MDPSTERFQQQMAVLHQSMCIFKAVTLVNDMSVWNTKIKNLICQISIKILKHDVIPKSSYLNIKICVTKVLKKYSKMNERMWLRQQL